MLGRYSLRPLWRRRPIWLRDFATEEDELGPTKSRSLLSNGEVDEEDEAEALAAADTDHFTGRSINDSDDSAEDTVVGLGCGSRVDNVRPFGLGRRLTVPDVRTWHLMAVTVFLLSLIGGITSLILTFAAGLGLLYLTPFVPCVRIREPVILFSA